MLAELPKKLDENIVGHRDAKEALVRQAMVSLSGMQDPGKPQMSLLFFGPEGVGKMELAASFAQYLERPFERIVMSQFGEYDQPVDLLRRINDALAKNAFTVFLIDEYDKAPKKMLDSLLSILDRAQFSTPAHKHNGKNVKSETVSARNATFIFAGNIVPDAMKSKVRLGFGSKAEGSYRTVEEMSELYRSILVQSGGVAKYLLDRVQDVIFMDYLSEAEFRGVLTLHFDKAILELSKNRSFMIRAGNRNEFIAAAMKRYYSSRMSNRAAIRIVQKELRYALASGILSSLNPDSVQELRLGINPSTGKLFTECDKHLVGGE